MSRIRVGMVSFAHSTHPERALSALLRNPSAEVIGIWDDRPERARPHAEPAGIPLFDDLAALLLRCDAVVVSSEYDLRAKHLRAAVDAGVAILCEKPLAPTAEMLNDVADILTEGTRPFMVAFPCRFIPAVVAARGAIAAGEIGRVLAVNATNRGACPHDWFVDPTRSGGGAIMDHTAHAADLIRWLTGAEYASIHALAGDNLLGLAVEDSALLHVEMTNGVVGSIDTSWSRTGAMPSTFDITMRIIGTEGTIEVNALAQHVDVYAEALSWNVYSGSIDDAMIDEFLRHVSGGSVPSIGLPDVAAATALSFAAYRSIEEGKVIRLVEQD